MAIGAEATPWLNYDRGAILAGEAWRIVTAHVVHLQWSHLAMNLAGLSLVWWLFGQRFNTAQWVIVTTACMIGVSAGVMLFDPGASSAAGMSALLHGMFAAGALAGMLSGRRLEWVPLALLTTKLCWEAAIGPMPGSEAVAGGPVHFEAHVYGALVGLISAFLMIEVSEHLRVEPS
jgi:rhomboid family GlyGly-CTERM serine protease